MVNKIIKKGFFLALLACISTLQVQAEIYKCVNKQGKTFYNDKSCPAYDKETQIKAVKDPINGYVPPAFVKDKEGKGKILVIGGDASKELKKSTEKKKPSKDENTNLLKSSNSTIAGGSPYVAPISDSGRVFSSSSNNNKPGGEAGEQSNNPKISALPRVELKVEQREY